MRKTSRVGSACAVALGATILALNARSAAPDDQYTVGSDTVFDNKTQLTWQRAPSSNTYTWQAADDYCKELGLGGLSWRLPAVREFLTLIDTEAYNPSIDARAFPNTPTTWFWSSSPSANVAGYAWIVDSKDGSSANDDIHSSHRVRCVR